MYTKPNKEKTKEKKLSQELNIPEENPTLAQNLGYCGPEPSVALLAMAKFCWENFISAGEVLEDHEDLVLVRGDRGRLGKHRRRNDDRKPVQVIVGVGGGGHSE